MDISGVVGFKIVKGGVKAHEFFCFMTDLAKQEISINSKRKILFFMDNAKVHHLKYFMEKFVNFYNVMYNTAYIPQLNPIELLFSRLKSDVKKLKSKTEKVLIINIHIVCKTFTS